jgi:hypoxanthine phosphoribosyltransferase
MHPLNPEPLIEAAAIAARLEAMGGELTDFYRGKPLTVVVVLQGALFFAADLLRHLPLPMEVESFRASSYHGGRESSGTVTLEPALAGRETLRWAGRHLLVLDDILDTGRTLGALRERLLQEGAASVRSAVLLSKRKTRAVPVEADHVGFEIGDCFVVGYGLDDGGMGRNLPYIAAVSPPPPSGISG